MRRLIVLGTIFAVLVIAAVVYLDPFGSSTNDPAPQVAAEESEDPAPTPRSTRDDATPFEREVGGGDRVQPTEQQVARSEERESTTGAPEVGATADESGDRTRQPVNDRSVPAAP